MFLFRSAAVVVIYSGASSGFAVVFFNVLGYNKAGVCELSDVRNIIILSKVDTKKRPRHDREGGPYDTHLFRLDPKEEETTQRGNKR
ncbi:Uncharacterized protein TCM_005561 [Theobroma cacao]|uniref:Uncharacterized protein n=1 Tax=Theobroma cacao TaxID=3641 RepID=A0A061E201_THECC|nr:Uncharacterized protein TCM_005561 [Theobroma cacao]